MPGQFYRQRRLYIEWVYERFGHVGKEWYGLICGDWPIIALFRDRTFYHNVATYGLCVGPLEIGLFIDFRTEDEKRREALEE